MNDERFPFSQSPKIARLFGARSIVFVGASPTGTALRGMVKRLRNDGFPGKIWMINPKYDDVLGYPCFPKLADLPETPDLAVITLRASVVPAIVREVAAAGVRSALVYSTGFADAGPEGLANLQALVEELHSLDIAFCGPGSFGFADVHNSVSPFSAGPEGAMPRGNVAVVAQSGGFANILGYAAPERKFGFSYLIATGSEAVLSTEVVVAMLEEIRDVPRFHAFLTRAHELQKPVIFLGLGRSEAGKRATSAHSGALAARNDVQEAFLRQNGAMVVHTIDDLLETLVLLSAWKGRAPENPRLALVTVSGGDCALVLDLAADVGLKFPELAPETQQALQKLLPESTMLLNPVDLGTRPMAERHLTRLAYDALVADPNIDVILTRMWGTADDVKGGVDASNAVGKPHMMFSRAALSIEQPLFDVAHAAGVPTLQSPDRALAALQRAAENARFRRTKQTRTPDAKMSLAKFELTPDRFSQRLAEREALQVLAAAGIEAAPSVRAMNADEAAVVAPAVGFPVAVKIDSPDIEHKSDIGGVRLDIGDVESLRRAVSEVLASARSNAPGARIDGVIIQPMRRAPLELIYGLIPDEKFGAAVVIGFGGLLAEMLGRTVVRLAPFGIDEAKAALTELLAPKVGVEPNFRNLDIDGAAKLLAAFSSLGAAAAPYVEAIEINPVAVFKDGKGACALDCLILPRGRSESIH